MSAPNSSPNSSTSTPPHKIVEFQAVILAGSGHRMYPLTEDCPKSLLPIANRPLCAFQLDFLESSGFTECLIITRPSLLKPIQKYVETEYKGTIRVQWIGVDSMGTADALRMAKHHIKTDFFVLSGDLITNIQLHYLADIHRCRDASLTVLLQQSAKERDQKEDIKKKEDDSLHSQYIGLLDTTTTSHTFNPSPRLIYFKSANDVEDEFKVGKFLLKRHHSITMHTRLRDAHLYLFAHWILDLLDDPLHKDIQSIQSELIPFMVKHQYDTQLTKYRSATKSHQQQLALSMSHGPSVSSPDECYRCYVYIASSTLYCQRANTVATYLQINRDLSSGTEHAYTPWRSISSDNQCDAAIKQFPKAAIGTSQCVLGDKLSLGDGCSIKRSIIGRGVKLGNNAKINNSILMNHVVVEEGSTITDSILCSSAIISRGITLKDCRVGANFTVPSGLDYKGEVLCHDHEQ